MSEPLDVYLQPEDLQPGDLDKLAEFAVRLPEGEFRDFIEYLYEQLDAGFGVHIYSKGAVQ